MPKPSTKGVAAEEQKVEDQAAPYKMLPPKMEAMSSAKFAADDAFLTAEE